jgi:hypothetical protein
MQEELHAHHITSCSRGQVSLADSLAPPALQQPQVNNSGRLRLPVGMVNRGNTCYANSGLQVCGLGAQRSAAACCRCRFNASHMVMTSTAAHVMLALRAACQTRRILPSCIPSCALYPAHRTCIFLHHSCGCASATSRASPPRLPTSQVLLSLCTLMQDLAAVQQAGLALPEQGLCKALLQCAQQQREALEHSASGSSRPPAINPDKIRCAMGRVHRK